MASLKKVRKSLSRFTLLIGAVFSLCIAQTASAQTPLPIYTDGLVSGFQDWGWATRDFANTSPVHSGSRSIRVELASPWQGVQIGHPPLDVSGYESLSFWINSGANINLSLKLHAFLHLGSTQNVWQTSYAIAPRRANTWIHYTIPLASLGVSNKTCFSGFVL